MKETSYFSHDTNAKDDPKCMLLIEQLGLEGYGIFWVLVEILRDQPNYTYPTSLIGALARRFLSSKEKFEAVIKNYGLFKIRDDMFFYSESLIERMTLVSSKHRRRAEAGRLGGLTTQALLKQVSSTTKASKVKESKVKESKVKESIDIFNFWISSPNLIKHKKIDTGMQRNILEVLKDYSYNNIIDCIRNYNAIIKDKKYFYSYSHSFEDFFRRGKEKPAPYKKFLDEMKPFDNLIDFNAPGSSKQKSHNQIYKENCNDTAYI